jgi:hypothetical protein
MPLSFGAAVTAAPTSCRNEFTPRSVTIAVAAARTERCPVTYRGKVTSAYSRWVSMLQRCFNPNHKDYRYYGGRGITVCERWLDFVNFLADMGEPPPGLSLDRINVNGDYEPGNCRWATASEQVRNRRPPKRKRRRSSLAEIQAYAASLARAASAPGGARAAP